MRLTALLLAATLVVLTGGLPAARAQESPAATPPASAAHPLILVTFANTPSHPPGLAGTTSSHYGGTGYQVAQSAHRQAQRIAATYSLREVANWPIRALSVHCVVYEVPDNRPVEAILSALAKDPQVALAQPLQQFHTLSDDSGSRYNDPLYDLQANLTTLGIPQAHARSQGAGIRVALIDTAVDTVHPDLQGRIAGSHSFVDQEAAAVSGGYRHGTAMAGLIAATANNKVGIVGVAPLAQVEVFEACWQLQANADAAACNTFTLAKALAAAIDAGFPLVNLSIAGPADPLLSALVEAGLKRGAIFVGASSGDANSFPTNIPGVISVGGNERNAGQTVAARQLITAPSVHVLTLRPRAQYDFVSGTSVAAAEVTGVIALLLAVDPHLTHGSIEELLRRSRESGSQATAADALSTAAPVDANAALSRIEATRARRVAASSSAH